MGTAPLYRRPNAEFDRGNRQFEEDLRGTAAEAVSHRDHRSVAKAATGERGSDRSDPDISEKTTGPCKEDHRKPVKSRPHSDRIGSPQVRRKSQRITIGH